MSKTLTVHDALAQLDAALDAVVEAEVSPADVSEASELVRAVERAGRRVRALQIKAIEVIDERELYRPDGHASARVMVEHSARLSEREAKRRERARRALKNLPAVAAGLATGAIGACHVDRLALVHANPRVQEQFVALDAQIAILAARLSYPDFDDRLTAWVRQMDEDGTADRSRRRHEGRKARLHQEYDGGWDLLGGFGSLTGAQMHDIHQAFIEAEFQADWADAREVHGDATTVAHLDRTFDQRSADAMTKIFLLAADARAAEPGGSRIDTTIVMDDVTFERELLRAAGADVEPRANIDLGPVPEDADDDQPDRFDGGQRFRCETIDGYPIDPTEAFANALAGRVRRAVVGFDGVVLDLSGYHTLFTGSLREAVKLALARCYWPGCNVRVAHCQMDHLDPRRNGGRTNPGNGAPACGRHNRLKEHGYSAVRDARGRMHVYRPDGTELE